MDRQHFLFLTIIYAIPAMTLFHDSEAPHLLCLGLVFWVTSRVVFKVEVMRCVGFQYTLHVIIISLSDVDASISPALCVCVTLHAKL